VIEEILHFEEAVPRNSPREVQILQVAPRGTWACLRTADKDDAVTAMRGLSKAGKSCITFIGHILERLGYLLVLET
jgi:hypothetical protein